MRSFGAHERTRGIEHKSLKQSYHNSTKYGLKETEKSKKRMGHW
jgi:hypothetical protein